MFLYKGNLEKKNDKVEVKVIHQTCMEVKNEVSINTERDVERSKCFSHFLNGLRRNDRIS